MTAGNLKFISRDTRDHSAPAATLRQYQRIKGKNLKHILLDRFLNQVPPPQAGFGYDKGTVSPPRP